MLNFQGVKNRKSDGNKKPDHRSHFRDDINETRAMIFQ